MTVQRARSRATKKDTRTRRERLREALLPHHPMLVRTPRPRSGGWRTETYSPFGLGTHRDWRFAARDCERSR